MSQEVLLQVFLSGKLKAQLKPPPVSYSELISELRKITKSSKTEFLIQYTDLRNEKVLIYSQVSYLSALQLHTFSTLAITVEVKVNPSQTQSLDVGKKSVLVEPVQGNNPAFRRVVYPTGEIYEGTIVDDRLEGQGKMTFPSGKVLTGEFVDGKLQGTGVVYSETGVRYEGSLQSGLYHSQGVMLWPDGTGFIGEFAHSLMHGEGKMFLPNGCWMEGTWRYGKLDGENAYHYQDGRTYIGGFKSGQRHGPGVFIDSLGQRVPQSYEEGVLQSPIH